MLGRVARGAVRGGVEDDGAAGLEGSDESSSDSGSESDISVMSGTYVWTHLTRGGGGWVGGGHFGTQPPPP